MNFPFYTTDGVHFYKHISQTECVRVMVNTSNETSISHFPIWNLAIESLGDQTIITEAEFGAARKEAINKLSNL